MNNDGPDCTVWHDTAGAADFCRTLAPLSVSGIPCPRCKTRNPYRLASGRFRCAKCRHTFSAVSGRWLGECRLGYGDWVRIVELFEAEHLPDDIAIATGRAHATIFHAVTVIRAAIVAHSATCASLLYDNALALRTMCGHRGHKLWRIEGHLPVFGLREEGGRATVAALPDIRPQHVLSLPIKKVRHGAIAYTGQALLYDSLIFCVVDETEMARTPFSRSPTYIDEHSRFWAYARPRLAMHHGVNTDHFPLYIKELEFRYNHRGRPLAPILLRYLCDFVPRAGP